MEETVLRFRKSVDRQTGKDCFIATHYTDQPRIVFGGDHVLQEGRHLVTMKSIPSGKAYITISAIPYVPTVEVLKTDFVVEILIDSTVGYRNVVENKRHLFRFNPERWIDPTIILRSFKAYCIEEECIQIFPNTEQLFTQLCKYAENLYKKQVIKNSKGSTYEGKPLHYYNNNQ